MHEKKSWILTLEENGVKGIGEISIIEDLSPDFINHTDFEGKIIAFCRLVKSTNLEDLQNIDHLEKYPSILFGVESALLDLQNGGIQKYFDNGFFAGTKKIPINGLVWMGDEDFMQQQIDKKLKEGFTTIKMKIGAIDLDRELKLLSSIRQRYDSKQICLRVDANGAFSKEKARKVLNQLAQLEIHSIEQPIKAGKWIDMKELCLQSPLPIALDEELIGICDKQDKINLLEMINPQYIILKPSLHGGISGTKEWIKLAEERNINWWLTSALESNIGLNVICQLAAEYENDLPQGLGTGSLYTNNIPSDLTVEKGHIYIKK
jgi:o-succinylbenzoate synthase